MTAKHLLSEIVAGLDGVSEGPWSSQMSREDCCDFEVVSAGGDVVAGEYGIAGPPDAAHIARLSPDRIRAIAAYVEQLEKALEPFAEAAASYDPPEGDDSHAAWAHDFTIGSLRRARAALGGSNE